MALSPKIQKAIVKSKEMATKYIQKSDYEKALGEYRILAKLDPGDLRYQLKLGECLSKLNRKKEAIEEYRAVLKLYADKGFLIQAIAIGKVILQIDPSLNEIEDQLAELNSKRGIGTLKIKVARPAFSLKGVNLPIASAVKKEVDAAPAPSSPAPPISKPSIIDAVPLPDVDEESALPPEDEGAVSEDAEQGDELELTEKEEEEIYKPAAEEEQPEKELEAKPDEKAEAKHEPEDESKPIALDAAPDEMDEIEEPKGPPMPEIPLFSDLGVEEFKLVMQKFQIGNLPKGITVIKEGTKGDSFYIIAEGKVRVFKWSKNQKKKLTLTTLEPGSFFGEFAFLTNSIRSASIETIEDCVLLRINRKDLEDLIKNFPRIKEVLNEFYKKRVLNTLFQISQLFANLDDADRKDLIGRLESVMLDTGDIIIKEGEDGRALYMIKHGAIGITRRHPETNEEIKLAVLREGDFFGEISLLNNTPTTATCTAIVPTDLFRLPKAAFSQLIMMHPQILDTVSTVADQRSKETQKALTAKQSDRQTSGLV